VWRRTAAAALFAATVAACGVRTTTPPAQAAEWRANARQVVQELQADIAAAAAGGTTRASAARALANLSDMYGLLVAYSDLGGCRAMVGGTGAPPRVASALGSACTHLQRAAALFARAARRTDPAALAQATRESALAEPQLVRALLAVQRG